MVAATAMAAEHAATAAGETNEDLGQIETHRQRLFQKNKEMLNLMAAPAGEAIEAAVGGTAGPSMAVAGPITPPEGLLVIQQGSGGISGDEDDGICAGGSGYRGRGKGRGGKRRGGGGRGRGGRGGSGSNKKQRT